MAKDMKNRHMMRISAWICLLAGLLLLLTGCGPASAFDGSRFSDASGFRMEYNLLNREESADLQLAEGDRLQVTLSHTEGSVDVIVSREGKEPVYRGKDQQNAGFFLDITEPGVYQVTVSGHRAKGSVSFTRISGGQD